MMKKNYGLIVNPDTTNEEVTKWTGKYGVVIRPSQNLQKTTVIFSEDDETVRAISEQIEPVPWSGVGLPRVIFPFVFKTQNEAIAFLSQSQLIIGYDHINNIKHDSQ